MSTLSKKADKAFKKLLGIKPKVLPTITSVAPLTKGDLKKLKAQGKIKNIYERH